VVGAQEEARNVLAVGFVAAGAGVVADIAVAAVEMSVIADAVADVPDAS
jgi:hypothetical protein